MFQAQSNALYSGAAHGAGDAGTRQTAPRDSSGRISFPRQTKPRPSQPPIHSSGKSASRSIQAAGDLRLRCQPAARASAASAPYRGAVAEGLLERRVDEADA